MIKKRVIILLLTYALALSGTAQSPLYRLSAQREIPMLAAPIGYLVGEHFLQKKYLQPLSAAQIQSLDPNTINVFDRSATRYHSSGVNKASDILFWTATMLPASLLFSNRIKDEKLYDEIGTMWAETFLINAALTGLTKSLAHRTRPYAYNPNVAAAEKMKRDTRLSFFSGHTSSAAATSIFTAQIFADLYPNSRWKPLVWTGAAVLPLATGLMRYRAGKHFPTDILVGAIVGTGIGLLVPALHRRH